MRVYQTLKYGEPAPRQFLVWDLVFRTGWSIEYIESLSVETIDDYLQIQEAQSKVMNNG